MGTGKVIEVAHTYPHLITCVSGVQLTSEEFSKLLFDSLAFLVDALTLLS